MKESVSSSVLWKERRESVVSWKGSGRKFL